MNIKAVALISVSLLAAVGTAHARDFTIAGWGGNYQDAQREAYFKPFAAEQNLKFIETTYLGGLAELKTMADTNNVIWDLVIADGAALQLGCDEGLFEPLDWDKIQHRDELMKDAISTCGVGNVVIGNGFAYNSTTFPDPPKNWADFFDMEKFPGKRGMRNTPEFNLEFALMGDGVPVDKVYEVLSTPEGVDRAFAKLDLIKDQLQLWDSGSQSVEWLAAGNVALSSTYNARIIMSKQEGQPLEYIWTNQVYSIDHWAIPTNSPYKEQALAFFSTANNAQNQAKFSELMPYGATNVNAIKALPPEVAKNVPAGENIKDSLFRSEPFWIDNVEALTERWRTWATR